MDRRSFRREGCRRWAGAVATLIPAVSIDVEATWLTGMVGIRTLVSVLRCHAILAW